MALAAGGATGCDEKKAANAKAANAKAGAAKESKGDKKAPQDDKKSEPPAGAKPSAEPAAAEPPAAKPPADGWTRLELSSVVPQLRGTIDLPPGAKAQASEGEARDADGLQTSGTSIKIGPQGGGVELRAHSVVPPRFGSAEQMLAFHKQFEKVSSHEHGPDHFSVVQKWRPGECMLHGWSKSAGLSCTVFKAPCDEMQQWVDACASLQAGAEPNAPVTTAKTAFEGVDIAAAEVAMTVARGVARNDVKLLVSTLGPPGVKVGKKTHDAAALEAALKGKTVLSLLGSDIPVDPETPVGEFYTWNTDGPPADAAEVKVWFFTGYGVQPFFKVKKVGDAWQLVEFGTEDLGEP